jgi:hypothetical protein
LAAGTPPDEVRPDVGWDRMSSADDDDEDGGARSPEEPEAGSAARAGTPSPGPPG